MSRPSQHHAQQTRHLASDCTQPHVTLALPRPPLPYEVMHAYLPAQEKMAEMVHSPISTLLYFIDHTNLLTVWSALLLECKVAAAFCFFSFYISSRARIERAVPLPHGSKVMIVSSKVERLTPVLEGLRSLLFPLQWPHVYISNLFLALADFINAPMPFLIGVLRHVFTDLDVPDDVMVVDIDVDEVRSCSPKPPPFPPQHLDFLSNALQVITITPDASCARLSVTPAAAGTRQRVQHGQRALLQQPHPPLPLPRPFQRRRHCNRFFRRHCGSRPNRPRIHRIAPPAASAGL